MAPRKSRNLLLLYLLQVVFLGQNYEIFCYINDVAQQILSLYKMFALFRQVPYHTTLHVKKQVIVA